jgi:cytochrome P450
MSKAFTPRAIEALRPHIQALVNEMLDPLTDIATASEAAEALAGFGRLLRGIGRRAAPTSCATNPC